jgi:hypothetical protein
LYLQEAGLWQLKKLSYFCHLFIILIAIGAYAATPALQNYLFSGCFGVRAIRGTPK